MPCAVFASADAGLEETRVIITLAALRDRGNDDQTRELSDAVPEEGTTLTETGLVSLLSPRSHIRKLSPSQLESSRLTDRE
jgi:hypothetical protein